MRGELITVAVLSAMVFLFGMPLGIYLMSFSGEGLAGNVLFYAGAFALLPWALLRHYAHLGMGASLLASIPLLYLWFALWVGLLRWRHVRASRAAPGRAGE